MLDPELKTSHVTVRTSYEGTTPVINELFPMAFVSFSNQGVTPPMVGYKCYTTQAILNNLPSWMKARQDNSSRGWKFMNACGMNLDTLIQNTGIKLANMFLETADVSTRSKLYRIDLSGKDIFSENKSPNLIFNGSFSIRDISRTERPAGWFDMYSTRCRLVDNKTLIGTWSLHTPSGAVAIQTRRIEIKAKKLTASVYYFTDSVTAIAGMSFIAKNKYGSDTGNFISGTGKAGSWNRLSITLDFNDMTSEIAVMIGSSKDDVYFSGVKVEIGESPTAWSASEDRLPYLNYDHSVSLVKANSVNTNTKSIILFPLPEEELFTTIDIPTRVERITSPLFDISPSGTQSYGRVVSFHRENIIAEWVVSDDNRIMQRAVDSKYDIFNKLYIKELRIYHDGSYGTKDLTDYTRTIYATCTKGSLLFVACKETLDGRVFYVLKIVNPQNPPNDENYLESIVDFRLDIPLNDDIGLGSVSETITSMGFSETEPSYLVINTSAGRRFYYKLHYDYYFVDVEKRILYTLEKYDLGQLQVY